MARLRSRAGRRRWRGLAVARMNRASGSRRRHAIAMRFTSRSGAPFVVGEQGKPMSSVFCCPTLTRLMTTPECIVHEFQCHCSLRLKVFAESVIEGIPSGWHPAFCPNCRQEHAFFTKPLRIFYADGDKWLRAPLPSLRFRSLIQLRQRTRPG